MRIAGALIAFLLHPVSLDHHMVATPAAIGEATPQHYQHRAIPWVGTRQRE